MQMIICVMVISCSIVGVITNRRFGHATFFRNPKSSKERPSGRRHGTWLLSRYATRRSTYASSESSSRSYTRDKNDFSFGVDIYSIPPGVTEHILSFSSPAELVGLAPVCRDLCRASESDLLWRALCARHFGKEVAVTDDLWRQQWEQRRKSEERDECFQSGASTPSGVLVGSSRRGANQAASSEHGVGFAQNNEASSDRDGIMGGQVLTSRPTATAAVATGDIASLAMDKGRESVDQALTTSGFFCRQDVYSWRDAFFDAHFDRPRELFRTSQPSSCLILVWGRVHDLTGFLPVHPGGAMILREHASTDATVAFERFFHSSAARKMARQFVVWDGAVVMGRRGTLSRIASRHRQKARTTG